MIKNLHSELGFIDQLDSHPRLLFRSMPSTTQARSAYDWRTITALNAVSTVAQIGQFGIIFVIVPVWLALLGLAS